MKSSIYNELTEKSCAFFPVKGTRKRIPAYAALFKRAHGAPGLFNSSVLKYICSENFKGKVNSGTSNKTDSLSSFQYLTKFSTFYLYTRKQWACTVWKSIFARSDTDARIITHRDGIPRGRERRKIKSVKSANPILILTRLCTQFTTPGLMSPCSLRVSCVSLRRLNTPIRPWWNISPPEGPLNGFTLTENVVSSRWI